MKKNGPTDAAPELQDPKPELVQVRALRYHTTAGQEYHEGDVYEVPADQVLNLFIQRMAARVEVPVPPSGETTD